MVVWAAGGAGLAAYNWWLLIPLRPGLMRSPNELFSNLEVNGQPYAGAMRAADVVSGVLLLVAFAAASRGGPRGGRRESVAMMVFAAAGAVGGIVPEACPDTISAGCRRLEWGFGLPLLDYAHSLAGIAEFAGITVALILAFRRTRGQPCGAGQVYRALAVAAVGAYPLLGLAYLTNRLGGVMEALFFTGFTVMALTHLRERAMTASRRGPRSLPVA